ncbi:glycosyltransferase family 10 [Candidatus Pacearchaeota archaeon]|jgi:hypothetical protein|nr:glycosyltransferase family 10 [Candidatus Pacearchaeota archaeon]
MCKEVNIVYYARQSRTLEYEGEEGKVWMSNCRDPSMPNIFFGDAKDPQSEDSIVVLEPIVTTPSHYDLNYLSKFKTVFSWANKFFETSAIKDKFVPINCGSELCDSRVTNVKLTWPTWEERINGVVIISCNKTSTHQASIYCLREMLADLFYENGFVVDWFGHSNPGNRYYRGSIPEKIRVLSRYRFGICTENTYDPIYSHNYFTEKPLHVMYSGTVPLYLGAYNVDDILPKDTFFDLRNFVIKKPNQSPILLKEPLMEAIRTFSNEKFNQFTIAATKCLNDPMGIFYQTSMPRCYKTILETLCR